MQKCAVYPYNTNNGKDFLVRNFGLRFHFNGQETDDEIAGMGNIMSAEFWEYDTRLGRRWNRDPVIYAGISPYAVLNNNPISFVDPLGLDPVKPPIGPPEYVPNEGPDPYQGVLRWIQILDPVTIIGGPKPTIVSKVLGWIGNTLNKIGGIINKAVTWLSNPLNSVYFASGTVNAFSSDHMLGTGAYNMQGSDSYASAHRWGQTFGHAAAAVAGAIEFGSGSALTITSDGLTSPASVPLALYGSAVTGVATANLIEGIVYMVSDNANGNPETAGSSDDALTNGGRKKLGNLIDMQDLEIGVGILKRGGNGSNVNKIASWLRGLKIGKIANLAAKGDEAAEQAIKILKQAEAKGQRY